MTKTHSLWYGIKQASIHLRFSQGPGTEQGRGGLVYDTIENGRILVLHDNGHESLERCQQNAVITDQTKQRNHPFQ